MPVWAWAALGFGIYYWYTHYGPGAKNSSQSKKGQAGQGQGGSGAGSSSQQGATTLLVTGPGGYYGAGGGGGGGDDDDGGRGRRHRPGPRPGPGNRHHARPSPGRLPGGRIPTPLTPGGEVPGRLMAAGDSAFGGMDPAAIAASDAAAQPYPVTAAGGMPMTGGPPSASSPVTTAGVGSGDLAAGANPGGPDRRGRGRRDRFGVRAHPGGGIGYADQAGGAAAIYQSYQGGPEWKTAVGWEAAAINYLIGEGVAPEEASTSVWTYLHGEPQSARMHEDVQLAIDGIGSPPGGPRPAAVQNTRPQRNTTRPAARAGQRVRRVRVVRV